MKSGCITNANGNKYWYVNGKQHRDNDIPVIEYADGTKVWWLNGLRHRTIRCIVSHQAEEQPIEQKKTNEEQIECNKQQRNVGQN